MGNRFINLLLFTCIAGCSVKNDSTAQDVKLINLFEVDQLMARGTGYTVERYRLMNEFSESATIKGFMSNPKFEELKRATLNEVEGLINATLNTEKARSAVIECIKQGKAPDDTCNHYVQGVMNQIIPKLQTYGLALDSLIVNLLQENGELNLMETSRSCALVRNGRFQGEIGNEKLIVVIGDGFQTEQLGGNERRFKINWINECTYQIEGLSPVGNRSTANGDELYEKSTIEIINVTGSYYLYKIFAVRENTDGLGNLVGIGKLYRN